MILSLLILLAGIAVFLLGVNIFGMSLKKSFANNVQSFFKNKCKNRLAGVGIGAVATTLMQSSTATTTMVVSLVDVGSMNLRQAAAIIMGANIGTTTTGLMIALASFDVKYVFMSFAVAGILIRIACFVSPAITRWKSKIEAIANILIGFGLVFVGLHFVSMAFAGESSVSVFFKRIFSTVKFGPALILLGAVFVAIIQSSGMAMAIYISMLSSGSLSLKACIFLVLGSEIGTCTTALLASIGKSKAAKKAASIHLLFNVASMLIFAAMMFLFGGNILSAYQKVIADPAMQLAIFGIVYNIASVLILVWFIPRKIAG